MVASVTSEKAWPNQTEPPSDHFVSTTPKVTAATVIEKLWPIRHRVHEYREPHTRVTSPVELRSSPGSG